MRFLVPLVAALVPLLITPGLLSYFDVTPKVAILLLGASLSLLYSRENLRNVRAILSAPAGRWFAALLAAAWLSSALATVFSSHPMLSLNGGTWRRFGLLSSTGLALFVLVSAAWLAVGPKNIRTFLRACTASGGLAALYGIAQYFGWDPWLPSKAYQAGEGAFTIVRPPGTLGHADYFAAWLLIIAFFGFALARMEEERWLRIAAFTVSALSMLAILLSGTRAALLGLFVGLLAFAILRRSRIRAAAIALGLAGAAGLALLYFSSAGAKLRARVQWSVDDARGGARLLLWRDSVRMASHRPLLGFGPETFATEFPRFASLELARSYPDFYHESPHNMFLDALTAQGGMGLLALAGLCWLALWAAARGLRSGSDLAAPLAAGFAGTLVCQQFGVLLLATALYFYLLLALLVVAAIRPEPSRASAPPVSSRWLFAMSLPVSLLLASYAILLLVADRSLAVAQREVESGNAIAAAQAYRDVLRWQPAGAGSDLKYSRAMQQLANRTTILTVRIQSRQQALEAGVRATKTSEDRQNAWYNLALLLAGQNDAAGVEQSLRNAIACAPNWFKPHWTLAQILELSGRHDEALAEAVAAVDLDGNRDPEVTQTLRKLQQGRTPAH